MLEKHLYDSWKSIMELYVMNRPLGRMILASVEKGPLVWPTITVDGVTDHRHITELTLAENIQADQSYGSRWIVVGSDVREITMDNQGRPFQRNNARGNGVAGNVGAPNRGGMINPGQVKPIKCYNCNGLGHIARECPKPKRLQDSDYFKDKTLLWDRLTLVIDVVDDFKPRMIWHSIVDHIFEADECYASTQMLMRSHFTDHATKSTALSAVYKGSYAVRPSTPLSIHDSEDFTPDYSKENLLATFAPQRNLTPEQIFWSIDDNNRKKAETLALKPISALTVYPPNTPVKLVPRILPTKSQVKINLYIRIRKVKLNIIKMCIDSIKIMPCSTVIWETSTHVNEIESLKGSIASKEPCFTCDMSNKVLLLAINGMCVVNVLNSGNATPTVRIVLHKEKQIWKPKGKLSDKQFKQDQADLETKSKMSDPQFVQNTMGLEGIRGELFADIGYQWRPTGKKLT
ncbi:retrovirus-related pol polyprotein from transposon TNT 1-94 [Tanacetum coccineum]